MVTGDTTSLAYALRNIQHTSNFPDLFAYSRGFSLSLSISTYRQFLQAPARARLGLSAAIAAAAAAAVVVAMIGEEGGGSTEVEDLSMLQPGLWVPFKAARQNAIQWRAQLNTGRVLVSVISSDKWPSGCWS